MSDRKIITESPEDLQLEIFGAERLEPHWRGLPIMSDDGLNTFNLVTSLYSICTEDAEDFFSSYGEIDLPGNADHPITIAFDQRWYDMADDNPVASVLHLKQGNEKIRRRKAGTALSVGKYAVEEAFYVRFERHVNGENRWITYVEKTYIPRKGGEPISATKRASYDDIDETRHTLLSYRTKLSHDIK